MLVDLAGGGDVLLLAESMSVPDFVGMMKDVRGDEVAAQGEVIDLITTTNRGTTASTRPTSPPRLPRAGC